MSIRTRFTFTVVAVVAITAALFATLSILALDRALHRDFQSRLRSTARTVATTADVHGGRPSLDPSDLRSLTSLLSGTAFAIFDRAGNRVAGNAPPDAGAMSGIQRETVSIRRAGAAYGSVTVWERSAWIEGLDREAALISLAGALFLVALGVIVSRRVAARVLAPVGAIASLAERIEGHDLSGRLRAGSDDELGRLCASFDRMLDRLESAFARERRFVADASHELRAPLAVLRAETELALRRERTTGEYRAALESVAVEASRLDDLVDELLATARAAVDAAARQVIDAGEMVRRLGDRVRAVAATRGMEVHIEADAAPAQAHRNRRRWPGFYPRRLTARNRTVLARRYGPFPRRHRPGTVDRTYDRRGQPRTPRACKCAQRRRNRDGIARRLGYGRGEGGGALHSAALDMTSVAAALSRACV